MLPDFSPYLINSKFHFTLNQYTYLIISSCVLVSCSTYYISLDNFKQQFKGIDSNHLKMVKVIQSDGDQLLYQSNKIDTIFCVDENNKTVKLLSSPSIEIIFTDNNNIKTEFYFDTIFLKDSTVVGSKLRYLPILRDKILLNNIKSIEVRDGKNDYKYYKEPIKIPRP